MKRSTGSIAKQHLKRGRGAVSAMDSKELVDQSGSSRLNCPNKRLGQKGG